MIRNPNQPDPDRILRRTVSPAWGYAAGILLALVFVSDLITPLGFAHGMFYVLPLLLAVLTASVRWVGTIAVLSGLLTVLGLYLAPPPDGIPMSNVVANRAVSLAIVAAVALLALNLLQLFRKVGERGSQASDALRELERNQRLLEVASRLGRLGGWSISLPDRTLYWSSQVRAIYGLPEDRTPSLDEGVEHYASEDQARITALVEDCISQGRPFDAELQLITADDQRIWVRAVGAATRNDAGDIIAVEGALQDITEPKAQEASLVHSHQRFRQLADAMPLIVWTAEPDGRVDYFSQALIGYTGLSMRELSHTHRWLKALHREDRARCLETWEHCNREGTMFSAEARILRRDGEYRWHLIQASPSRDEQGSVVKWYGSAMEIHERVRLEQEALSLSRRLTNNLESMSDAFFLLDREWRFTYLNGVAERLLQRNRGDLLGRSLWGCFPEARESDFHDHYTRAVHERCSVHFQSYYPPLETWFEVNAYPSSEGLAVYFQNINERLRMEEALRESQRLESLGELTGGVAHDFNNLLTVIMGNSEVLQGQLQSQPRLRLLAEITHNAARRGAELTQRLLAFARRQTLAPRSVDVNALLTGMADLLKRTLGDHIQVDIHEAADLWPASVDPAQLEAAVLNLCLNARDAMPDGGHLMIESANLTLSETAVANHVGLEQGDYVTLSISDTGHGIGKEHLHRIFEPFFTTKEIGKGTGLGLSMVYGFVKQSRGQITVSSEPDTGTTMRLHLPRDPGGAAEPEPAVEVHSPIGGTETILLVEDNNLVLQNARTQLESLGYRVLTAGNGPEAMRILHSNTPIDLLFTDVMMPGGMNGPQLAEAACGIRPGLRVLYTSGYTSDAIIHQGRLAAGIPLLPKPYHRADLARKVRETLDAETHHKD